LLHEEVNPESYTSINKESPAFSLFAKDPDNHTPNLKVEVSWSELKNSKVGDEWIADIRNNTNTATILFKDKLGVFIRFVNRYHPVYGNDDYKNVDLEYFHFF